jgi:hypothetical protein
VTAFGGARALYWRDLVVIGRRRSMLVAVALYVGLLSAFLGAWKEVVRVPLLPGSNLYEQYRVIQWVMVAVILPWAVCRFIAGERGERWSLTSFVTGLSRSRLFTMRLLALGTFAGLLVGSGLPLILLAQQMSSVPATVAVADLVALFLFSIAATVITMSIVLIVRDVVAAWLLATTAVLLFRALVGIPPLAASAAIAAGIVAIAIAAAQFTVSALDLRERRA